MVKYRKKPVIIEAMKFEYTMPGIERLRQFMGNNLGNITKDRHPQTLAEAEVKTLEDGKIFKVVHIATEGDYIIKGIQNEFYACKPDIFEQTYEKAED